MRRKARKTRPAGRLSQARVRSTATRPRTTSFLISATCGSARSTGRPSLICWSRSSRLRKLHRSRSARRAWSSRLCARWRSMRVTSGLPDCGG